MAADWTGAGTPAPGHRPERAITDAHLHLWDLEASDYAWMQGAPALRRTGTWEQVGPALATLGTTRVVLVQADDTPGDTAHMQCTAERIEAGTAQVPAMRADVVAWLPLENPAQVENLLGDAAFMQRVVGVRHLVHDEPDAGFLERPAVARPPPARRCTTSRRRWARRRSRLALSRQGARFHLFSGTLCA